MNPAPNQITECDDEKQLCEFYPDKPHIKDEFNYFTIELRQLLQKYGYSIRADESMSIIVDRYDRNKFKGVNPPDEINLCGGYGFSPYGE